MKKKPLILLRISHKRYVRRIKSKRKRFAKRRKTHYLYLDEKKELGGEFNYTNTLIKWLPTNITFILGCKKFLPDLGSLQWLVPRNDGIFLVPKNFSIRDEPKVTYLFIKQITAALLLQSYKEVKIDYNECENVDLGTQVFLDIILKDVISFYKKCARFKSTNPYVTKIDGINIKNEKVKKLLFSVGSPAIHASKFIRYPDIVPYSLCIHNSQGDSTNSKSMDQKDVDTTTLVDYVLSCLKRVNKSLTQESIDNLCIVISEILINAEEHSTTKHRFSIGYFTEINEKDKHYGVFRLVILNLGQTIYEKFKDPDCPNKGIVSKMKSLSETYTKKKYFFSKSFEEETLWTLYSLQEGVTSIAPEQYKKRGNGSIQFIESFFNLRGAKTEDHQSNMVLLSGNTKITFDGTFRTIEKESDGETFTYITFNDSENIEDKPNEKFVKFVDDYFPGTLISARIIFNEDDVKDQTE